MSRPMSYCPACCYETDNCDPILTCMVCSTPYHEYPPDDGRCVGCVYDGVHTQEWEALGAFAEVMAYVASMSRPPMGLCEGCGATRDAPGWSCVVELTAGVSWHHACTGGRL